MTTVERKPRPKETRGLSPDEKASKADRQADRNRRDRRTFPRRQM